MKRPATKQKYDRQCSQSNITKWKGSQKKTPTERNISNVKTFTKTTLILHLEFDGAGPEVLFSLSSGRGP